MMQTNFEKPRKKRIANRNSVLSEKIERRYYSSKEVDLDGPIIHHLLRKSGVPYKKGQRFKIPAELVKEYLKLKKRNTSTKPLKSHDPKFMKTFEKCKDEVAKSYAYPAWDNILVDFIESGTDIQHVNQYITEAAELYANSKAAQAWEEGAKYGRFFKRDDVKDSATIGDTQIINPYK